MPPVGFGSEQNVNSCIPEWSCTAVTSHIPHCRWKCKSRLSKCSTSALFHNFKKTSILPIWGRVVPCHGNLQYLLSQSLRAVILSTEPLGLLNKIKTLKSDTNRARTPFQESLFRFTLKFLRLSSSNDNFHYKLTLNYSNTLIFHFFHFFQ